MLRKFFTAAVALWAMAGGATAQLAYAPVANNGSTGTIVGKLAKFAPTTGAALTLLTSDTTWTGLVVGETVSTASPAITGNAILAIHGPASCIYDGTTVVNDYVTISSTVAGDCHDTGAATYPTSGAVVGIALAVNGGAGTVASTYLIPPGVQAAPATAAFSGLTSGTNTTAAMVVGTGASLATSGTGTVAPSTPISLFQAAGVSAYSTLFNGNPINGANTGTGLYMTLGLNTTGSKALILGDYDYLGTNVTNCMALGFSSGVATITGANCEFANQFGWGGITFGNTAAGTTLSSANPLKVTTDGGTQYLDVPSAAVLHLGQADDATAVAQTLGVQGIVAGTSNVAGQNWTIDGSQGTGTGAGGSLIFKVAPAAAGSATTQNALVTGLTIADNGAQSTITTIANFVSLSGIASSASALDAVCWNASGGVVTHNAAGALCSASLEELKDIGGPINPSQALGEIMALKPVWAKFKNNVTSTSDHRVRPMLGAHQVEGVDPRLSAYDGNGNLLSVEYMYLPALNVAAMQAMQQEVVEMRAEIVELKAEVVRLRSHR